MKGPATQQERVERARPAARDVLRLIDLGMDHEDGHIDDLVQIALQDYRLRFPSCPARQTWLFYDGNPATKRIRGTPERVDVYCTFCRVLLVNSAVWDNDYTAQLRHHTTICALRCLAGQMEPGAPGTYRLPTEI